MRRRGKTSSSCLHAIFEHEERANPPHPPQHCTTIGIKCEHSIPRVSTVYCPPPPLPPLKSSANARFQGWWALPVSHPRRRAAKARFCAHNHQSQCRKRLPLPNDRVRRGVMPFSPCHVISFRHGEKGTLLVVSFLFDTGWVPSSSCRSFLFDRLSTR